LSSALTSDKWTVRRHMRKVRRDHAQALDQAVRALLFKRPPRAVMELIPAGAMIGLYLDLPEEAPARAYARFLAEAGHRVALPAFESKQSLMHFREWTDPFGESDLEDGCFGPQPRAENGVAVPQVLFCPLVAFTERGERMGQGGGFYDRWLEAHPGTLTFGMAWDVQKVDSLPLEPHDRPLGAIITPTRLYGPFHA
jgi:5-formyltetrahydrofolate cyclo-ligase